MCYSYNPRNHLNHPPRENRMANSNPSEYSVLVGLICVSIFYFTTSEETQGSSSGRVQFISYQG